MSRPTTLYRLFDADGALLYIGIAGNPGRRFEQHAGDKPWWGQVVRTELAHYPTREGALIAERQAIIGEGPLHNVVHNRADGGSAVDVDVAVDSLPDSVPSDDVLAGQWFHSVTDGGNVNWQGKVLGRVQAGLYLVTTFSWIDGDRHSNQLVPVAAMSDWIFYDDHEWMKFSYEYGAAFGKRKKYPQ